MDRKKLEQLADNPRHIPGIYNYCDRWCERCPFTSRCLNFAIGEEQFADPASRDMHNQQFWNKLQGIWRSTIEMIQEEAAKRGIDLTPTQEDEKFVAQLNKRHDEVRQHPLVREAERYAQALNDWFEAHEHLFQQKEGELVQVAKMDLPGRNPEAEAADLNDIVEILRWYQYQIEVKLCRALGREEWEDELCNEDGEPFPSDADGSAKVSLIGIDRSIAAWARMREHFPEEADRLLDMLVRLDRLRRHVEATFPKARAFRRPGFDDPAEAQTNHEGTKTRKAKRKSKRKP